MPEPTHIKPTIAQIFLSFLRLGCTAFGGPSMAVFIRAPAVEKKRRLDADVFSDGMALCQMIPGATAMQTAAYAGLMTRGVRGALAGFVGFGLPAFLLMTTLSALYLRTRDLPETIQLFGGLQSVIVALVAYAAYSFGKTTFKKRQTVVMAAVAAVLFAFSMHPAAVIAVSGALGRLILPKGAATPFAAGMRPRPHVRPLVLLTAMTILGFVALRVLHPALFRTAALLFRIDLTAFGGGYASVPLILHEFVQVRQLLDSETLMNGMVLGQITPGPIVITATFIGYLLHGPFGSLVATVAVFTPSFLILLATAPYYARLKAWPAFLPTITGVLASFVGLLPVVTVRFAVKVHWDAFHLLMTTAAFVALLLKVDLLWVVPAGLALSVLAVLF